MPSSSGLVTATRPCRLRGVGQLLGGLGLLLLALAPWSPALAGPGAQQVVGGEAHTCTLTDTDEVWCWGSNGSGQLGDGTTTQRTTPVAVTGLSGSTALAAGGAHTCALTATGGVWCWGLNSSGQLGDGTTANKNTPVEVRDVAGTGALSGVKALVAGGAHTCALTDTGEVWCWGANNSGQLGDSSTANKNTPVAVSGLSGVTALAAGQSHTCALLADKTVRCWGANNSGQLGDGTTANKNTPVAVKDVAGTGTLSSVTALAAGAEHTCALLADDSAQCWGRNDSGQLGNGTNLDSWTPVVVKNREGTDPLYPVIGIVLGSFHSCALLADTDVQCWGNNASGQLGDGTTVSKNTPVATRNRDDSDDLFWIVALAAGGSHTCGVTDTGAVWCWGDNANGQLGDGSTTNSSVPVVTRPPCTLGLGGTLNGTTTPGTTAQVAAGGKHTCALTNGAAWCWGRNTSGQLGNGSTSRSNTPVAVSGLGSGVMALAAGYNQSCALLTDKTVKCWGTNKPGFVRGPSTPVAVSGLVDVKSLTVGQYHACALTNTGAPLCWGRNDGGQLGNGTTTESATPVAVTGLSGVTALAAGGQHTCALLTDTTVRCWGSNYYGQLGNGTTTPGATPTPVAVTGLSDVMALTAGYSHTCALLRDQTVKCWGGNDWGQLGDASNTDSNTPVPVASLTGVAAVSAGRIHTCAVLADTRVQCWGYNAQGQLGDGTKTSSNLPVPARNQAGTADLTGVTEVSAGGDHTCSRLSTGVVWCWGDNADGQLGTTGFVSEVPSRTVSSTVTATATCAWPVTDAVNITLAVTGVAATDYQITAPGGGGPAASMPASRSFTARQDHLNNKGPSFVGPANLPLEPPFVMTLPNGDSSASLLFTVLGVSAPGGAETATLSLTNPAGNMVLGSPTSAFLTLLDTAAPPTLVGVTPGPGAVTVRFTNSPGATGYTATCTSSDGGAPATATGTASPILVSGLTTGKTYSCTVAANYGQASSDPSPASDPVIVTAPAAIPTLSQWGLLMLGGLLAAFGMRRRQRLPTR